MPPIFFAYYSKKIFYSNTKYIRRIDSFFVFSEKIFCGKMKK